MIPLMLIIKISYVLIGDYKSIFYIQKRVGKNGKIIEMYKFRSMVYNADEILKEVLKDEKKLEEWKNYQKLENDPRITKIGKFLRKTSLDEFPQFLNVFKGDMTLIGPRPLVPGELEEHHGIEAIYQSVTPGIASYWSIHGRSNCKYEERLELEYYYIENMNLIFDIKCVIRVFFVVLGKKGAI